MTMNNFTLRALPDGPTGRSRKPADLPAFNSRIIALVENSCATRTAAE
jgi:hypothetical protein